MRGDQVYREGITAITREDIAAARDMDCVIKLLAVCQAGPDGISARVHPALVPAAHPLGGVSGAFNAVFVEAREAGQLMFLGPGAGGSPTASAVMGDLVTVARNLVRGVSGPPQDVYGEFPILPIAEVHTRFHLRLQVRDEPGVLAEVAKIFASHGVSLQTVQQSAVEGNDRVDGWSATLKILTHEARECDVKECVDELTGHHYVNSDPRVIRVEGM